jgi:hypothetical protein
MRTKAINGFVRPPRLNGRPGAKTFGVEQQGVSSGGTDLHAREVAAANFAVHEVILSRVSPRIGFGRRRPGTLASYCSR